MALILMICVTLSCKLLMKLTIRLVKAPDLPQSSLSLLCFCVYLTAEELGCPSFPFQLTGLQVKATHAAESIEPLLIYLGTALPCLEGREMEMRLRQDSEGDLRA